MNRKKCSLPDSLELLLDTMCNTFGGIMFIAISLIIISQLITKTLRSATPEEIDEKNIRRMEKNISGLQDEILTLKKRVQAIPVEEDGGNSERTALLKELSQLRNQVLEAQDGNNRCEVKILAAQELLKRLQQELRQMTEAEQQKRAEFTEKQHMLDGEQQRIAAEILQLQTILGNLHPREIRFSEEKSTTLNPYWVLLKNNRLYRWGEQQSPLPDEVATETLDFGKGLRLIPVEGTDLNGIPEEELRILFKNVDRSRCFVMLVSDYNSFSALLTAKQYLRNHGFKVNWTINPQFEFGYADSVDYRASE